MDSTLRVLAHRRRRTLLAVLEGVDGWVPIDEAATAIVTRERDPRVDSLSPFVVSEVEKSLRHVHVPVLSEAGVVDVDGDRDALRAADLDPLEPFFSEARRIAD